MKRRGYTCETGLGLGCVTQAVLTYCSIIFNTLISFVVVIISVIILALESVRWSLTLHVERC